jgi:hypothetical protein
MLSRSLVVTAALGLVLIGGGARPIEAHASAETVDESLVTGVISYKLFGLRAWESSPDALHKFRVHAALQVQLEDGRYKLGRSWMSMNCWSRTAETEAFVPNRCQLQPTRLVLTSQPGTRDNIPIGPLVANDLGVLSKAGNWRTRWCNIWQQTWLSRFQLKFEGDTEPRDVGPNGWASWQIVLC